MPKVKPEELTGDDKEALEEFYNITYFERFCGNCDNFETDRCPFLGKVYQGSEWKNIGCDNFDD